MITKKYLLAMISDARNDIEWLSHKIARLERDLDELSEQNKTIKVAMAPSESEKIIVKTGQPEKKRGRGRPRKNA